MALFTFDPVGNLNANRIQNELHTISVINGVDHNYIVPVNAPFYDESVVMVDVNSGRSLVEQTDYFFAYNFVEASTKVGKPISGAIVLVDPNRTGNFLLNYQTLGGEYVDDTTQAIANGINALVNITSTDWEDLVNVPATFPPTPHTHRLSETVGIADILAKFTELETAIRSPDRYIMLADIVDLEDGLLTPIYDNFNSIAVSIQELTTAATPQTQERTAIAVNPTLNNVPGNIWTQALPDIQVVMSGTYSILFGGLVTGLDASGNRVNVDYRYTVNGQPISKSYVPGSVIGLSVDDTVRLEVRHNANTAVTLTIFGPDNNCGISIIRLSS